MEHAHEHLPLLEYGKAVLFGLGCTVLAVIERWYVLRYKNRSQASPPTLIKFGKLK